MGITEIPRAFVYKCDICVATHKQENASGPYANSRPPRWARLRFDQAAEDFQGAEVADASVELLLCPECKQDAASAINRLKKDQTP